MAKGSFWEVGNGDQERAQDAEKRPHGTADYIRSQTAIQPTTLATPGNHSLEVNRLANWG